MNFPSTMWKREKPQGSYEKRLSLVRAGEKDKIKIIRDHYDQWLRYTRPKKQIWKWCEAFSSGVQWGVMDFSGTRILVPPVPEGRRRVTVDMISPWRMDTVAKLTATLPTIEAVPNTLRSEDKQGALVGDKFLSHYWEALEFDQEYQDLTDGVVTLGTMYYRLWWDENAGPQWAQVEMEEQMSEELGRMVMMPKMGMEPTLRRDGDLVGQVLRPECVFDDGQPGDIDDKLWVGIATWEMVDQIDKRWNKRVTAETTTTPDWDHQVLMNSTISGMGMNFEPSKPDYFEGKVVFTFYMPPQPRVEEGWFCELTGDEVLNEGPWPRWMAKMAGVPIVEFNWDKRLKRRYSQTLVEGMISLQKEKNRSRSQWSEAREKMLAIKWMNPRGSGVKTIDDLSGQMVRYNYGQMPTQSDPKTLPSYAGEEQNRIDLEMQDAQFRHLASKSIVPPGVKSGIGLSKLQEMDDRPISIVEKNCERSMAKVFKKVLQVCSVMITKPRAISYVGKHNERAVDNFMGQDLRDNTRVKVRIVSGLSKSPAAQAEVLLETFRIGGFRKNDGGLDSARFLEAMAFAIPGAYQDEDGYHKSLAREENARMWEVLDNPQTMVPRVFEWQMHALHLREHEEEMNSIEWLRAVEMEEQGIGEDGNPQPGLLFMTFVMHRDGHVRMMLRALQGLTMTAGQSSNGGQGQGSNNQEGER